VTAAGIALPQAVAALESAAGDLGMDLREWATGAREFLTGPVVVLVLGPAHTERAAVATALGEDLPPCLVREAAPTDVDPKWDVALLVTPADRALALAETQFVTDAAEQRRPVMVLISRMALMGDAPAQEQARQELDRFRFEPSLGRHGISWSYLDAASRYPASVAQTVRAAVSREVDHREAGEALLRRQMQEVLDSAGALIDRRRVEQDGFAAVRVQAAAQSAGLVDAVRTRVLGSLDRLRLGEESMYQGVDALVGLARVWLDSDGLVPWPDVEYPLRRAQARWNTELQTFIADHVDSLRAEVDHATGVVDEALQRMGLSPCDPLLASHWTVPKLEESLTRLREADLAPGLAAVHRLLDKSLATSRQENGQADGASEDASSVPRSGAPSRPAPTAKPGSGRKEQRPWPERALPVRSLVDRAEALRGQVGEFVDRLSPTDEDEVRGLLLEFLGAVLRPRVREVTDFVERDLRRASRTEVDAAIARLDAAMARAEDELAQRHSWSGAYSRLIELRRQMA
jgi:hypothetical protein